MSYAVHEMFATLQGEGGQTGRVSVFCRFSGCNLWSGREADRTEARCRFCDTEFVGTTGDGGGRFEDHTDLAEAIAALWPVPGGGAGARCAAGTGGARRHVVFTGGEPLLQLDEALISAVRARGFDISVETNGTLPAPSGIDWICVSPKAGCNLRQTSGAELKLVYPQGGAEPERFADLDFRHFFLQPMDGPGRAANTEQAIAYCLAHPQWRLSLQTHKLLGLR